MSHILTHNLRERWSLRSAGNDTALQFCFCRLCILYKDSPRFYNILLIDLFTYLFIYYTANRAKSMCYSAA